VKTAKTENPAPLVNLVLVVMLAKTVLLAWWVPLVLLVVMENAVLLVLLVVAASKYDCQCPRNCPVFIQLFLNVIE
jgi:hypothetical protein